MRNLVLGFLAAAALAGGAVAGIAALGDGDDEPASTTTVNAAAVSVPQYGMPTTAGNLAVHKMILDVRARLSNGRLKTAGAVTSAVRSGVKKVAQAGHVGVFNAEVRSAIFEALWPSLSSAGIDPAAVPTAQRSKPKPR